jgi:hypothetical protein
MKIGIGITAKDRLTSTELCLASIKKFSPNCQIVLIDDGSEVPIPNATFRFERSVGIAKAKNKCLELLDENDYIFLFDNDCWPIKDEWYKKYIDAHLNTGCHHFSFTFSHLSDGRQNGNKPGIDRGNMMQYHNACGCALFLTKHCLDVVGGFSTEYGMYGYEHTDYSTRANNLGLTPYRFCDIYNSLELFHSQDYHREVSTTVKAKQTRLRMTASIYAKNIRSKKKHPYKQPKTAIITTYFTGVIDPQKNQKWKVNPNLLIPLTASMKEQNLVVLHDCLNKKNTNYIKYVQVEAKINPYFQRWISILEYLKSTDLEYVFCVDATDVVMLKNPFLDDLKGYLFVGDEQQVWNCKWIVNNHHNDITIQDYFNVFNQNKNQTLLNAGIIGGSKEIVVDFLTKIIAFYKANNENCGLTDMASFNYIARKYFNSVIKNGRKINTIFKANDSDNKMAYFKHK